MTAHGPGLDAPISSRDIRHSASLVEELRFLIGSRPGIDGDADQMGPGIIRDTRADRLQPSLTIYEAEAFDRFLRFQNIRPFYL